VNLSDELNKLADLKREGLLTDQEFTDAKRRLLEGNVEPPELSSTSQPAQAASQFRGPPHECWNCGGSLSKEKVSTNGGTGCLIIILGLCLTPLIIGIPIILYGIHIGSKTEAFWRCDQCDSKFPRKVKWYEFG
jgi:hypothetical protein